MRVVVVGEGMIELSRGQGGWRLGHGGDTLNMAIHLARFGRDVAYATALGTDPFSDDLRAAWAAEGLDTSFILSDPQSSPGLYAIRTDASGERSFTYWRARSAARRLFALEGAERVTEAASAADLLCLSLISLAVLPPAGREALIDLCRRVQASGGRVAFDGNYRPKLWESTAEARAARDAVIACCDIGLPTLEDEAALSGASDAEAVADEWRSLGAEEVVVKLGGEGCLVEGGIVPPPVRLDPVDTSGAGDAFDAGYLHARLSGVRPAEAAVAGHRLAGWVVMRAGAIPTADGDAPYAGWPERSDPESSHDPSIPGVG